jgi:replication factor C subunit 2/4
MNIPWVDKYRPKKINYILDQESVINVLHKSIETGNLPHLLFYGTPGTGKTSTILALAHQLYGSKNLKNYVLELNASDENGINIVRNKIVTFAKSSLPNPDPEYPSPRFKLIILDEADSMKSDAQSALRKIIEEYSKNTRFCFICNYIHQIIEPIVSRCMKFRFNSISNDSIKKRLSYIAKREEMIISDEALEVLIEYSKGDARKSIMLLQNLKYVSKNINISDIKYVICYIKDEEIKDILDICFDEEKDIKFLINKLETFRKKAYPINQIIESIIKILNNYDLDDKKKSLIILNISNILKNLYESSPEYIQMIQIFSHIKMIANNKIDYQIVSSGFPI